MLYIPSLYKEMRLEPLFLVITISNKTFVFFTYHPIHVLHTFFFRFLYSYTCNRHVAATADYPLSPCWYKLWMKLRKPKFLMPFLCDVHKNYSKINPTTWMDRWMCTSMVFARHLKCVARLSN